MVDLQTAPRTLMPRRVVIAVKRLWWGAMIIFIDLNIGGWDLSNDIVGMALVTWACYLLFDLCRSDRLGQAGFALAVATTVFTVLYSIPATAEAYPPAGLISSFFAQVGIVVVALYLARLLRLDGLITNASRWESTARWHAATGISVFVFGGIAYFAGGFRTLSPNTDAVFDWAIASSLGLVAAVVSIALGLIAGVTWVRAAWAIWKY